jgi:hypothetical protein
MTEQGLWPQLLSSALVGTDRRRCVAPALDGPLASLVAPGELDADALLSAAAVVTVARRAGLVPQQVPLPEPAPAEARPTVPTAAGARLGNLLAGVAERVDRTAVRELTHEWLELAAARGLIVAPRQLVALLDAASGEVALRPLVRAVGGERLPWLAVQGPGRWAWAMGSVESPPQPDDWQLGTIQARTRHLAMLRERDASAGRDLLTEAWPQEKAADLAALIGACLAGLGPDDEPWLEKALDDRRVQIREAAARLLGVLPGSAYRQRMADRVLACVRADGKRRLAVTPPAEYDAGVRRDGVPPKAPHGMGERAWLLLQLVSLAPLDCWSIVDDDPSALLGRKVEDDWAGTLRLGWAQATVVQRDGRWAAALCRIGTGRAPASVTMPRGELAALLGPQELVEVTVDAVRRNADRMTDLLAALPRPWPESVAQAVLHRLAGTGSQRAGDWWAFLRHAETSLDPVHARAVRDLVRTAGDDRQRDTLAHLASMLEIRSAIHEEFV